MENKEFLKEMKKVLDGEETSFNSEAAQKVAEMNVLADKYTINDMSSYEKIRNKVNKRLEESGIKTIGDDEQIEIENRFNKYIDDNITETKALNKLREIFYIYDFLLEYDEELKYKLSKMDEPINLLKEIDDDKIKKILVEYEKIKKLYLKR